VRATMRSAVRLALHAIELLAVEVRRDSRTHSHHVNHQAPRANGRLPRRSDSESVKRWRTGTYWQTHGLRTAPRHESGSNSRSSQPL
jgi:hypothetical protein